MTDDSPLQRALARREAMLRGQRAPEAPAAEGPAAAPSSSLEARVALLRSARAGWPAAPAVEVGAGGARAGARAAARRGPTRADLQRIREDRAAQPAPAPPAAPAITAQVIADRLAALAAAPVAPAPRVARPDAPRTVTGRLDALAASLGEVAPPARQARQAIPGVERGTPRGRCFVQVSTRDPETRYGDRELGTLLSRDAGLASLLAGDAAFADFDPRGALFLDLETTGLAIGQGTLPFMIGAAWFRGEDLVLEQWLLRDADEEPAALEDLADRLADLDWLVTYNGRTFDLPLLAARYALHGMELPPLAGHLDLLPISRRLLKHGLPDCRLATVERRLLGVNRVDDLPGRLLPAAWLAWQHGEDAGPLLGGLRHNRDDVLSMVTLLDLLLERAATADSLVLRDPPAALALAAAALKVGRHAEAEAIFTAGASFPETAAAGARGLCRLARVRKKAEKKSGG
ncbi:MAG: ribonuclease H-like domain-containing protein [bacterium]